MNNLKDIKFFVINLDDKKDRWKDMVNQFKQNNITNYERFSAIRPTLVQIEKHPLIDINKFWNVKDISNECDLKYCIGAAGCKLSHYNLLKYLNQKKDIQDNENFIILEDDCNLRNNSFLSLTTAYTNTRELNINFNILYLGCNLLDPNDFDVVSEHLLKCKKYKGWATHAMLIKKKNIPNIITHIENSLTEIDNVYITLNNRYIIYPMVAYQRPVVSDILHLEDDTRGLGITYIKTKDNKIFYGNIDKKPFIKNKVNKWKSDISSWWEWWCIQNSNMVDQE